MTDLLRTLATLRNTLRAWFDHHGFLEVRTPTLGPSSGFDAYTRPFRTTFEDRQGRTLTLHLATSPEFGMKRLLSLGADRIWQIARSYRNTDLGLAHLPEFDMVEWYAKGSDYRDAMDQTEDLVRTAALSVNPSGLSRRRNFTCDFTRPFERISLPHLFLDRTGLDLERLTSTPDFLEAARSAGFTHIPPDASWDDIFFIIFLERVEPELLRLDRPALLYDYPAAVLTLARPQPGHPSLVERFECYAAGLELCNGYTELDDPHEHHRRHILLTELHRHKNLPPPPPLDDLEPALQNGLGLCSGVALGFERLAMASLGIDHIRTICPHPLFTDPSTNLDPYPPTSPNTPPTRRSP